MLWQDTHFLPRFVSSFVSRSQKNPLANVDRGDHSSWTAHFNVSAEEGQGLTFQQLEAFCDILRPLNGECTRNCDGDSCGNNVTVSASRLQP